MTPEFAWQLVIGGLSLAGAAWGIIRYLQGQAERRDAAYRAAIDDCHSRINKTRDEMVRRDDLRDHIDRLTAEVSRLSTRFDQMWMDRRHGGGGE